MRRRRGDAVRVTARAKRAVRAVFRAAFAFASLVATAAAAPPPATVLDLRLDAGWNMPLGAVWKHGDAIVIEGDAATGQAVILWSGLGIDATRYRYLSIEHRGLAPRHAVSLFVRSDRGENVIDIPETSRAATIELAAAAGWSGTISELGLVLGPQGNIPTLVPASRFELHRLRLEPASPSGALRTRATRAAQLPSWTGSSINVLPENMLTAGGGVLVFAGLLLAAVVRAGGRRRAAVALVVAGLAVVELAMARQFWAQRRETSEVIEARDAARRPRDLDWELVEFAQGLAARAAALGPETNFAVAASDPYVVARMRFHLLPYRVSRAGVAPVGALPGCTIMIGDTPAEAGERALAARDTAFGPVLAKVDSEDAACSAAASP